MHNLHCTYIYTIDIKKVDKQLTHAMHVKDRYLNDTFIDGMVSVILIGY